MKILITCSHYPVCSGRFVYDAAKRAGHDVRSSGPNMGASIWDFTAPDEYIWLADLPEKGWNPDLVIHMDGNLPQPKRIKGAAHVCYGVDNHVRTYQGDYDHLFLAHNNGYRIGEDNVTWLPCAYDPTLHTPGKPYAQRAIDAGLIGFPYGTRHSLLYALFHNVDGFTAKYGYALGKHYAAIYQGAKLSLVRSAKQDVAMRVFETAAMGCVVVMDECPDAELLGLEHGVNCLMYTDEAGAVEQVKAALKHPKVAARIAKRGQAWVKEHTWDARLQTVIDWLEGR